MSTDKDVVVAVRQWLEKAGSDWTTVEVLVSDKRSPAVAVCFHCQQYVEKLVKAALTLRQIEAPRTHDIRRLCELAIGEVPGLSALLDDADVLSVYAVQSRYPGEPQVVTPDEMQNAIDIVEKFAAVLLPLLREYVPPQEFK